MGFLVGVGVGVGVGVCVGVCVLMLCMQLLGVYIHTEPTLGLGLLVKF